MLGERADQECSFGYAKLPQDVEPGGNHFEAAVTRSVLTSTRLGTLLRVRLEEGSQGGQCRRHITECQASDESGRYVRPGMADGFTERSRDALLPDFLERTFYPGQGPVIAHREEFHESVDG